MLEGDAFRPLPGTASLGLEAYPVVLRYDASRLLIGRRFGGFWLYDGAGLTPFATELESFLKNASLYRGIGLPDGAIALSTTNAGMAIMDREGRRLMTIGRAQGLPSDAIYALMVDREGAIWTAGERWHRARRVSHHRPRIRRSRRRTLARGTSRGTTRDA